MFEGQEPPECQPPVTHSAGNGAWRTFKLGLQTVVNIFQPVVRFSFSTTFRAAESTVSSARKFSLLVSRVFTYSPLVSQVLLVQMEVINPSSLSVGGVLVLRVKNCK